MGKNFKSRVIESRLRAEGQEGVSYTKARRGTFLVQLTPRANQILAEFVMVCARWELSFHQPGAAPESSC